MSFRLLRAGALLAALLASSAVAQSAVEPLNLEDELSLRAEAQFATGDIAGGIATRMALEASLSGPPRSANRDALWRTLNALPPNTNFASVTEPVARGWVELMQLIRNGAPLAAFDDWRKRHPDHPGESQLAAGLVTPLQSGALAGRPIALLLPLTGPLAAAAKAIQAGAEAAQGRAGKDAPALLALDTSTGLDAAVNAALARGAVAAIGPLRKEDVTALAAREPLLPIVTLNYLDTGRSAPIGLTAFGLAPEDEARAAADHAADHNRLRAVVLAQEGDWGQRAATAFKAQLEARGGSVLDADSFKANAVDFTAALKRLFGISAAEARGKQLSAIGIKAELLPTPRGDVDAVFLAARSAQAKLIWPQMRYLRAGRIATYAPAAAGDGGPQDLGKLLVCDAPWLIDAGSATAALRSELAAVNPRTPDAQRLFALGYDAYQLVRRSSVAALVMDEPLPGLTGTLALEADGGVHRRLGCAPIAAPRGDGLSDDAAE